MKKNMGSVDRVLRFIVGAGILALGIIFKSWWGLVGVIPLGTSLVSRCPAYLPFGISTCSSTKEIHDTGEANAD